MRKENFFYLRGFTLAETLVTLAVIGVLASLTVPALLKSYQDMETVTRVKKNYSLLNRALLRYAEDNNCMGNLLSCGDFDGTMDKPWTGIKPYLKLNKDCGSAGDQGCFSSVIYKRLNGDDQGYKDKSNGIGRGILSDGSSILINGFPSSPNCSNDKSHSGTGLLKTTCGRIGVDINGHKGPNQIGRDYFDWWITKSGVVVPAGHPDDKAYATVDGEPKCDPGAGFGSGGSGIGCTAKILIDNDVDY